MIRPEQLAAALERLDPRDWEVLDLSLRRRVPDEALAKIFECEPADVARRRAFAIEHLADDLGVQRGEDLGAVLKALLERGTWEATEGEGDDSWQAFSGQSRPTPSERRRREPGEADADFGTDEEPEAPELKTSEAARLFRLMPAPEPPPPLDHDRDERGRAATPGPAEAEPAEEEPPAEDEPAKEEPAAEAAPPAEQDPSEEEPAADAEPPAEGEPAGELAAEHDPSEEEPAAEAESPAGEEPAKEKPATGPPAEEPDEEPAGESVEEPPPPAAAGGDDEEAVPVAAAAGNVPPDREPVLDMLVEREQQQRRERLRKPLVYALVGGLGAIGLFGAGYVGATQFGNGDDKRDANRDEPRRFLPSERGPLAAPFPSDPKTASCYPTAYVRRSVTVYTRPGGARKLNLPARTEWGSPRVMGVVRRREGWLAVQAPELANGEVAWMRSANARVDCVRWSLHVDLSRRRLLVRRDGRTVRRLSIAIGSRRHATPKGRFAVTDKLKVADKGSPYGCCVLALTGHQTRLPPDWPGGDRLAVHATTDASTIGKAVSLGCMRANPSHVRWLIRMVPLGTPTFIKA